MATQQRLLGRRLGLLGHGQAFLAGLPLHLGLFLAAFGHQLQFAPAFLVHVQALGLFLRVEMEDAGTTDATLRNTLVDVFNDYSDSVSASYGFVGAVEHRYGPWKVDYSANYSKSDSKVTDLPAGATQYDDVLSLPGSYSYTVAAFNSSGEAGIDMQAETSNCN